MKIYKFKMSVYLSDHIFKPCRSRTKSILNTIEILREILITPQSPGADFDLVVATGKFQRIFLISNNKIYSVGFPYQIQESKDGYVSIYYDGDSEITNSLLASAETLIKQHLQEIDSDFSAFFDTMMEELGNDNFAWKFLLKIVMQEDSYLRYDLDEKHADDREKKDPESLIAPRIIKHPLHHIDVFYNPAHTFKIGLSGPIDLDGILDILDPNTKCRMLGN
ncbi:hypothetical protein [Pseudomonas sp. FYR_11]|uniref:hypothetical protein n=1 Tax=Pseudomonas TaxID=286 RepID=UPI00370A1D6D